MQGTHTLANGQQDAGEGLIDVSPENRFFIQHLYEVYLENPSALSPAWQALFQSLGDGASGITADLQGPSWGVYPRQFWEEEVAVPTSAKGARSSGNGMDHGAKAALSNVAPSSDALEASRVFLGVSQLARAYRIKGHLAAQLDPLNLETRVFPEELAPQAYGLNEQDLKKSVSLNGILPPGSLGQDQASAQAVLDFLKAIYCGSLGAEFMYIQDAREKLWLQDALETQAYRQHLTPEIKKSLWKDLLKADLFERFLAVKYPAAKRFGLEGGESLIPSLEQVLARATACGVEQAVLGMAHRGRLNVLHNVLGLPAENFFAQFAGKTVSAEDVQGSGDVKYHLGASADRTFEGRKIHLSLTANPSHLESVNPVVLGKVRAKQDQLKDEDRTKVLGILIHGDAAFAGQGVVAESLVLSQLEGYCTGGTLHLIINNQIGFTTSPKYSRSSVYCSDLAKMIQAPIFHVNGDDPEAVAVASWIAMDYIKRFQRDVVIDLVCYRRHGHNEIDEPSFTQPRMYQKIAQHPPVQELYSQKLIQERVVEAGQVEAEKAAFQGKLQKAFEDATSYVSPKADWLEGHWAGFETPSEDVLLKAPETGVPESLLQELVTHLSQIPHSFALHPKLRRFLSQREDMALGKAPLDWSTGEALAFGTLLQESIPVRLSGQDCGRGTFTQRHAVFIDQEDEQPYISLNHLKHQLAFLECLDSPLSEAGVLGFELGYSLANPNCLVLWEAQFGDFANGAQVIIDQYIAAGEAKWLRMSGLVMLLPHGYEGQGPEHSSARLERYLQLCGENNLQVVNCSTPANYFHALRRQVHRSFRKPLIVMTPKSLLRNRQAVSPLKEFASGSAFQAVISDLTVNPQAASRVVLCSGKVYYDLLEARNKANKTDVALVRLEQFYPFPEKILETLLSSYGPQTTVVWCQEEPENAGAWSFLDRRLEKVVKPQGKKDVFYAGRPASASTATGFHGRHLAEQEELINKALG
ncbi:MAG: 2-oxoglutarate dehydrogenase E1 component, partial [Alphaproteobacteria bacterium]